MKLESEVCDEYCKRFGHYQQLTEEERLHMRCYIVETLSFRVYLLKYRMKEFIELLTNRNKED